MNNFLLYQTEKTNGTLCATRYHAQNSKSASLNILFPTETLRFLVSRHQVIMMLTHMRVFLSRIKTKDDRVSTNNGMIVLQALKYG